MKKSFKKLALVSAIALAGVTVAHAGGNVGGNTDFDTIWDTLSDWTTGGLGKVIAGSFVLIGLIGGIARGSLMALAAGVGAGLGLANAPALIDSLMLATLPVVQ